MQGTTTNMDKTLKNIAKGNCDMSGHDGRTVNALINRGYARKSKNGRTVTTTSKGNKYLN